MAEGEEEALVKDIGYVPTLEDDQWEKDLRRNGIDVARIKRIDKLVEENKNGINTTN